MLTAYVYQFTIQIGKISSTLKSISSNFKKVCGGGPKSIDFPGKHFSYQNKCSAYNFLVKYFRKSTKQVKQSTHIGCTTPTRCRIVKIGKNPIQGTY